MTGQNIGSTATLNLRYWWKKALDWWPSFLSSEEEFWGDSDSDSAPYPMEVESWAFPSPFGSNTFSMKESFVRMVELLQPRSSLPAEVAAILQSLDHPSTEEASLSVWGSVLSSYKDLVLLENESKCKEGRGNSVLHLWSSGGLKPPSKVAFNPHFDITIGDVVVMKVEKPESSGQRGWDLGEVKSMTESQIEVSGINTYMYETPSYQLYL